MPYIITTTEAPIGFEVPRGRLIERRAVATLDEARDYIIDAVAGTSRRESVLFDARVTYADALREDGGTVGPLPAGTFVKVKPVDWAKLAHMAGFYSAPQYDIEREELIDAFNNDEIDRS